MAASLPGRLRSAAAALLAALDGPQRAVAARPFTADAERRWLEYRPRPRPGACIAEMGGAAQGAHPLLATGLSDHAYTQAMAIIALEEVLDRREGWRRGRHSGDDWVCVFGNPDGDEPWSWRFEGHHLSVTMTVAGNEVSPAPVFLGANPACVGYAGRPVSRPLALEEDLARVLLDAMGPRARRRGGIRPGSRRHLHGRPAPHRGAHRAARIPAARLGPAAGAVLDQLVALYLHRLPAELAGREAARVAAGELYFAWGDPTTAGRRHYYRVQGEDLLIEYDNTTEDGNHPHTVLHRPCSDFGDDVLARHRRSHA